MVFHVEQRQVQFSFLALFFYIKVWMGLEVMEHRRGRQSRMLASLSTSHVSSKSGQIKSTFRGKGVNIHIHWQLIIARFTGDTTPYGDPITLKDMQSCHEG